MQAYLVESQTQNRVAATLVSTTWNHLQEARNAWLGEFLKRRDQGLQDDDISVWDCGILSDEKNLPGPTPYGGILLCQGQVQGVVIFESALQPSWRTPGSLVLYIKYLAAAPWNRSNQRGPGRFQYVGRRLMARAIRESLSLGCPGRIGLHSYPSAVDFHQRIGFEKFDAEDSHQGMTYFEMGPSAALKLLSEPGFTGGLGCPKPLIEVDTADGPVK